MSAHLSISRANFSPIISWVDMRVIYKLQLRLKVKNRRLDGDVAVCAVQSAEQ